MQTLEFIPHVLYQPARLIYLKSSRWPRRASHPIFRHIVAKTSRYNSSTLLSAIIRSINALLILRCERVVIIHDCSGAIYSYHHTHWIGHLNFGNV